MTSEMKTRTGEDVESIQLLDSMESSPVRNDHQQSQSKDDIKLHNLKDAITASSDQNKTNKDIVNIMKIIENDILENVCCFLSFASKFCILD